MPDEGALARAARSAGVEPEYWDIWGKLHETKPEVLRAILQSLGLNSDSTEALEAKLLQPWGRLTPPTLVLREDAGSFPISTPETLGNEILVAHVQLEAGGSLRREVPLGRLPVVETIELAGGKFQKRMVPLEQPLPLGYHELSVSAGSSSSVARLIVCPGRAWLPPALENGGKAAGVALGLYGLRSARNWGCGDLTDLEQFINWAAGELGVAFVALNPLHAIHNRAPFNTSPYLPNSIFYRNPIYLDIERLYDFRKSRPAQALFADPGIQAQLAALREGEFVEYERVYGLKLRFLRLCFETFQRRGRAGSECEAQFEKYCSREGRLLDLYAAYCALDEWIHELHPDIWIWPDWPEEYRDPDSEAARRFVEEHLDRVLFHKYIQWQLDLQVGEVHRYALEKGMSIGLYHDLALATDSCGSDLWGHRSFFLSGCRVGSPPDDFSPKGQDWGFPPPNAGRHCDDGYRLFIESIRHNARHGGALRIDHVMRFFRLFTIPDGFQAQEGTYLRQPHEDLLRILALESVRQKFLVVGEDLGTVAPENRQALERFGILSYRLLYFERDHPGNFVPPGNYPRQALVSSTTHDLATIAGFWTNQDIEARRAAGLDGGEEGYRAQLAARAHDKQKILDALFQAGLLPDWFPREAAQVPDLVGELHNAVTGFLARTPSMLLLVNQEDLTKETGQQNLPGSTWQYPNWRRKMKFSVEELRFSSQAQDFAAMLRNWLRGTGRVP